MNPVKSASPARPAKAAKPAKPARRAKASKPARKAKQAKPARRLASLAALALAALCAGCTGVYTPKLSAISWGLDSAQALSGLNVTRWQTADTNDYYEIILDSSTGTQSSVKLIDGLIAIGEIAARARASGPAAAVDGAPAPADWTFASATTADSQLPTATAPAAAPAAQTAYSADGYGGSPGPAGEGVYGRPSCGRCRAYRAAHPDTAIIYIDSPANRDDMWAALRLRGFAGQSVALPVVITPDAYTQAAK